MTQLTPRRFKMSNSVRREWRIEPEFNTPPEALLDSGYWAHVSAQMTRGDIVCAFPEDNSYFSELLVIDVGKLYAKVVQLRCVKIDNAQMFSFAIPDGYDIKFRGPRKWSVLRGKDVLREDMEKSEAERWLTDHVKVNPKAA